MYIPKEKFNVNYNRPTVVCEKHFADRFIVRVDSATRPDGSILTVPSSYPKLTDDAYPSLFPNTPFYLSSEPQVKRRKPEDRKQEQQQRSEKQFEEWMISDQILDFTSLVNKLPEFLQDYSNWMLTVRDNKLCVYKLNITYIPTITIIKQIL